MQYEVGAMKHGFYKTLSIILLISLFDCCSDSSDNVTCSKPEENLILNSSFEFNNVHSLEGWVVEDTNSVAFSNDVPEGGKEWSVEIEPGWVPQTYTISYLIAAPEGTHRYMFSFWAKRESISSNARLWVKSPDVNKIVRVIGISCSYWVQYSTLVSMNTQLGDTIIVELDGGSGEITVGNTNYDLVKLVKLD